MSSDLPPWTGSVDAEALVALLAMGGERDWLDYKQQCELSTIRGEVELAKDAGAMMMLGGYLLVGADDSGQPSGTVNQLKLFDPAILHDKLGKYLPKHSEIRSAIHEHRGQSFVLIYIAPHPDGFCIFERDGVYQDGKEQKFIFRAGEVYARHGTKSERWKQEDQAMIIQRLRADADRGRDQRAEATALLVRLPAELGGTGIWLGLAVVPEYQPTEPAIISREAAQQFLRDWHESQAPIEGLANDTATYRQPGSSIVITSQGSPEEAPWWWRLGLYDAGLAVGAHVLTQKVAEAGDQRVPVQPVSLLDGQTILVQRDKIEIYLLELLDLLSTHAAKVGAGGRAQVVVMLVAPGGSTWKQVALVKERTDDMGNPQAWQIASARAHLPREAVIMRPAVQTVRLAEMRDIRSRLRVAHRLAAELLAIFSVDGPAIIREDGTIDPYGAPTGKQQLVYQHARYLGLPVDPVSPNERRQQLEQEIQTAKERYRQH